MYINTNAKKVHNVFQFKVPCRFSPTHKGEMGTHRVLIMTNKADQVVHSSCECEHKIGAHVAVMDTPDSPESCYRVVRMVRELTEESTRLAEDLEERTNYFTLLEDLNPSLLKTVRLAYDTAIARHNRATKLRRKDSPDQKKAERLSRLAQNLTGNSHFAVHPISEGSGCFAVVYQDKQRYAALFEFKEDFSGQRFCGESEWQPNVLPRTHVVSSLGYARLLSTPHKEEAEFCAICNERYFRMGKHVHGAPHQQAFQGQVEKLVKLFTKRGVKAMNQLGVSNFYPKFHMHMYPLNRLLDWPKQDIEKDRHANKTFNTIAHIEVPEEVQRLYALGMKSLAVKHLYENTHNRIYKNITMHQAAVLLKVMSEREEEVGHRFGSSRFVF